MIQIPPCPRRGAAVRHAPLTGSGGGADPLRQCCLQRLWESANTSPLAFTRKKNPPRSIADLDDQIFPFDCTVDLEGQRRHAVLALMNVNDEFVVAGDLDGIAKA